MNRLKGADSKYRKKKYRIFKIQKKEIKNNQNIEKYIIEQIKIKNSQNIEKKQK